ncbi:MAG: SLBB domain-containing protein [Bacteroidota bacterium]
MKIILKNIFYCCFVFSVALSQDEKQKSSLQMFSERPKESTVAQPQGIALEDVIDPMSYTIGASDVLSVNIWISPPANFLLTVTPEGTLIIPTVGELHVADMLLVEAKKNIITAIKKKYISGEISATLITPRPIVVTISGAILNPGTFTARATDRVDKIIQQANQIQTVQQNDWQVKEEYRKIQDEQSTRNIVLKRKDGTRVRVDLPKFYATKEQEANPYLREGDVIIIPRKDKTKNVVGIYGEVNTPGRYEFVEGDSIHDLIEIAHGFTPRAIADSIEYSRFAENGKSLLTTILNGKEIFESKLNDAPLQPGDRIIVKPKIEMREDYIVEVKGEVRFPGKYPITKEKTTLSEIIKQAGGFTEFSSLKTAEIIRRSVQPEEIELERLLSARGNVSIEDSAYYVVETNLRIRKEVVTIDFNKLFHDDDKSQDVTLRTNDVINIPSIRNTIYVFGQVETPGNIPFIEGKDLNYYIQKVGGYTENAREADLRIIKSKTKQWLAPEETTVEEGDYIWIPKIPDRTFAYYATVMSQVASVLSVVVGIAVVVSNIK